MKASACHCLKTGDYTLVTSALVHNKYPLSVYYFYVSAN